MIPSPQAVVDLVNGPNSQGNGSLSDHGASVALSKLADSICTYQQATIRNQAEKDDNRLKAWRRLPKIQQNIILLGGVDDQGAIPEEATEEMMSILGCQNGAQVDQFLRQSMADHNMRLEPGRCTAINKGIFCAPMIQVCLKTLHHFLLHR